MDFGAIGECSETIYNIRKESLQDASSVGCYIIKVGTLVVTLESSIVTSQRTLQNIKAMPYIRETLISFF
jgi:hypothetical protein